MHARIKNGQTARTVRSAHTGTVEERVDERIENTETGKREVKTDEMIAGRGEMIAGHGR